jgi:hypothetical protein
VRRRPRPVGRALGLLAVTAALALGAPGPTPAAARPAGVVGTAAAPSGACTDPSGVTVVVDFGAFGGGVEVRCAGWPVADGYDALRRAGFAITDTTRFPGLLCKIDGLPADQACVNAPPPDAHWGYSHAVRGGSWTYSSQGARSRTVEAGDVEGWAFGKAARPSIAPPAPAPTTTTAAPPPTAPPTTVGPAAVVPGPVGAPTTAAPAPPEPETDTSGDPVEAEAEAADATTSTAADRSTSPHERSARRSAGPDDTHLAASHRTTDPGSGSPLPAVATAAVVVALVGGGVVLRRRRGVVA